MPGVDVSGLDAEEARARGAHSVEVGVQAPDAPATDSHTAGAPTVQRLDLALVARGLARSRTHAGKLVAAGRVRVDGVVADRPSRPVTPVAAVLVEAAVADAASGPASEVDWVSRGAVKLDAALTALARSRPPGVVVAETRCLDAGASTGGFTEVLLRRGAASVAAVDVGRDQLAASLRRDPRVTDHAGTSVRGLSPGVVGGRVGLLVADLSFISLRTVLADLLGLVEEGGDLVLMVKPQFEVGKARLPRGGVVRDPGDRETAVLGVVEAARAAGCTVYGVNRSALPGPAGNVEFFVWLGAPRTAEAGGDHQQSSGLDDARVLAALREGDR